MADMSKTAQEVEKVVNKTKKAVEKVKPEAEKAVKAATDAVKKASAPRSKEEIFIQFAGAERTTKEIVENIKTIYVAQGHKRSEIKNLKVYVKPEEGMAYYVINEDETGSINL